MSWERSVNGKLVKVVTQPTDCVMPIGGVSAGNSSTLVLGPNPLAGARLWDKAAYYFDLDSNVISGTFNIDVQGTVMGIANLPIARVQGLTLAKVSGSFVGTSTLPYGSSCITLTNSHSLQSTIAPTSVLFDMTAAGNVTGTVIAVAKTNRGTVPGGTLRGSRVQEGVMFSIPVIKPASYFLDTAGVTTGITQSTTVTLSNTSPAGTTSFGVLHGMDRVQVWDSQMYWMHVTGCSGLWNVAIQGLLPGSRDTSHFVTIAGFAGIGAGTTVLGVTKIAFTTFGNAATIKPSRVVFDAQIPLGVSINIAGTIVYVAKTTRGQRFKN